DAADDRVEQPADQVGAADPRDDEQRDRGRTEEDQRVLHGPLTPLPLRRSAGGQEVGVDGWEVHGGLLGGSAGSGGSASAGAGWRPTRAAVRPTGTTVRHTNAGRTRPTSGASRRSGS